MMGITTSQTTVAHAFGDRVQPTTYLFALRKGVDPAATAKRLETAFLANGMQADALTKLLHDTVAAQLTFDRLIEGFMGLGLIVGVDALGVIGARAVVERRERESGNPTDAASLVGLTCGFPERGIGVDSDGSASRLHEL